MKLVREHQRPSRVQRRSRLVPRQALLFGHRQSIPYAFSGPGMFLIAIILVFPVVYVIINSAYEQQIVSGPARFVGFGNYLNLLSEERFWDSVIRSLIFISGCVVVGQFLAIIFAFTLNRAAAGLRFLRGMSILPYIASTVAAAVMFRMLFNRNFGLPNQVLQLLGLEGLFWLGEPALAMFVVIVAQVWTDLPLSMLVILGGLQTINRDLLDAADVDGAPGWKRAIYVSLPLIAPQLLITTVWFSYSCFTSLGVILALTGGGPGFATTTLPMDMYRRAFVDLNFGEATAIVVVILLLNAVLSLLYMAVKRKYDSD